MKCGSLEKVSSENRVGAGGDVRLRMLAFLCLAGAFDFVQKLTGKDVDGEAELGNSLVVQWLDSMFAT